MSRRQFVVIGLGGFGETIACELVRLGHDVLGLDIDDKVVDRLADSLTHSVAADGSDEKALKELNVSDFDAAVVALGENIESSLLTTLHLKSLGLKEIWVEAVSSDHHRILAKIGATRILHPEYEMGMHVAQALNHPSVNNYISLGNDEYIVEIIVNPNLHDKSIKEILKETEADLNVLLVRRKGETKVAPEDLTLQENDQIVLWGQLNELRKTESIL